MACIGDEMDFAEALLPSRDKEAEGTQHPVAACDPSLDEALDDLDRATDSTNPDGHGLSGSSQEDLTNTPAAGGADDQDENDSGDEEVLDDLDGPIDSAKPDGQGCSGSCHDPLVAEQMAALLSSNTPAVEGDDCQDDSDSEEEEEPEGRPQRRAVAHTAETELDELFSTSFRTLDEMGLGHFNSGGWSGTGYGTGGHSGVQVQGGFGGGFDEVQHNTGLNDDISALTGVGMTQRRAPRVNRELISLIEALDEVVFACSPAQKSARRCKFGVILCFLLVLGMSAAAFRPVESSLRELVHETYKVPQPVDARKPYWPMQMDKSLDGTVESVKYINQFGFAIGKVTTKVDSQPPANNKKKEAAAKFYEHRYVGIFNKWFPVPYLPQPGSKKGMYGLGACVVGRCVCVPDWTNALSETKKATKGGKSSGCFVFKGDGSAALNVMAAPTILLFVLWQFSAHWSKLEDHTTLSMKNLAEGRIWVLLLAPLSHRRWVEMLHLGMGLANTLDSFDNGGLPFWVFALLYWGGAWAAWYGRIVMWRWLVKGDSRAYSLSEMGGASALTAQLAFLSHARPGVKYSYRLYWLPVPVDLLAWQAAIASIGLDLMGGGISTRSSNWSKIFSHATSLVWGCVLAILWMRTQADI